MLVAGAVIGDSCWLLVWHHFTVFLNDFVLELPRGVLMQHHKGQSGAIQSQGAGHTQCVPPHNNGKVVPHSLLVVSVWL